MIKKFIDIAENFNVFNVELLGDLYNDNAVFVHPFKTVRGKKAIVRQWKLSLKYCPHSSIITSKVEKINNRDSILYMFDWNHSFILPNGIKQIDGETVLSMNHSGLIDVQIDSFDLSHYNSLFHS